MSVFDQFREIVESQKEVDLREDAPMEPDVLERAQRFFEAIGPLIAKIAAPAEVDVYDTGLGEITLAITIRSKEWEAPSCLA